MKSGRKNKGGEGMRLIDADALLRKICGERSDAPTCGLDYCEIGGEDDAR